MRGNILMKDMFFNIKKKKKYFDIFFRFWMNSKSKKHLFLLGTPLHGNVGDLAIAQAEVELMERKGYKVCEMPSPNIKKYMKLLKRTIKGDKIYIHGGGFIGTLWPEEEAMFERLLEEFHNNKIIVLPQTIYFEKKDERLEQLNRILGKCKDITICAREKFSYDFACENFKSAKILLVPDMVLGMNIKSFNKIRQNRILFCMREDVEKNISDDNILKLKEGINNIYPDYTIDFKDTVLGGYVLPEDRRNAIDNMCEEFAKSCIVITDRLHGMVLSAMTNATTFVLSNNNYKVEGLYNWINNNQYIHYCKDIDEILMELSMEQDECNNCFDDSLFRKDYRNIEKLID